MSLLQTIVPSLLAIAMLLAGVTPSPADEARCNADKLKSLSRALSPLLACRAQTVGRADPPDPDCPVDADDALTAGFAEAEADPACASTGEVVDVRSALRSFDGDLLARLVVTPAGARCASAKLRATSARAKKEISCRRRAALAADPPDPDCVADAQDKLAAKFSKKEAAGDCETTGDAAAVGDLVSEFVAFAASRIDGTAPEPHPSDLAAVVNGAAIELSWTAADPGSGLTDVRVLRVLNAAPSGPEDPAAAVVYEGTGTIAADDLTALLPDTPDTSRTYHYAVYGCDTGGNCETTGSLATIAPTVLQALRAGGYVLHWRHASADVCSDRTDYGTAATTMYPDWWKSCDANCGVTATARQLNATGEAESIAIGDAFAMLGIPVGRVLSSEFCRNVETATLMDFGPVIEQVQELTYFVYDEAARCSDTFVLLGEAPAAGTNTALIGHAGNTCLPLSSLAWAEAAVYKPDGLGGATYIDRVTDDEWLTLP